MPAKLCDRCRGACCEEAELTVTPDDFFADEWLTARFGPQVLERRVLNGKAQLVILLESRCPKLTDDGRCSVHESAGGEQPTACRLAAVGGPECFRAIRRRRPELWSDLDWCGCNANHECEAHRA